MKKIFDGKYCQITDAEKAGKGIKVTFGNGDVVEVPTKDLKINGYRKIDWDGIFIEMNGRFLSFSAQPMDLEISGYIIRRVTDPQFALHLERLSHKQQVYVGKRIVQLRRGRRLSIVEVARKAKLKVRDIYDIEAGVSNFPIHHSAIRKILIAMGCSFGDLSKPKPNK